MKMAQKEYLKMADVFVEPLCVRQKSPRLLDCCGALAANFLNEPGAKYAAHAINSHDDLVEEVERLREMVCRMGMYLEMSGEYPEMESDNPVRQWLYDAIEIMTKQKRG